MSILPVILCGGAGARLWPVSRPDCPKPFLALTHPTETLFEQTLNRISSEAFLPPLIIGNIAHGALLRSQLARVACQDFTLLLEPVARNTAASLAFAALWAQRHYGNAVRLLVLPSDHAIADDAAFIQAIHALNDQLPNDTLGLFGTMPTRAETGYGYIECASSAKQAAHSAAREATRFTEKPALERAQAFCASGQHYWNSGMFLFPLPALLTAFAQAAPQLYSAATRIWVQAERRVDAHYLPLEPMESLPDISLDHALLQHCSNLLMQPLDCGWSDVGTWQGLWHALLAQPQRKRHKQLRPWGQFEPIYTGKGVCVKHLLIHAGGILSLQYHHHRTEHWTVIRGQATIQCDDVVKVLNAGESAFIPQGMRHRIANNQPHENLEIIEIQQGTYLNEDDIIRLDDAYGRHLTALYA